MNGGVHTAAMTQHGRRDAIAELVMRMGTVRIEELPERFDVSIMTIHRDLDTLASAGVLRKSRGTVTAMATSLVEASIDFRARQQLMEKTAIAHVALTLIEPGQSVILDDSTTGLALAELLPQKRPLTVITNSWRVLNILTGQDGITLISTGGQHYQWCDAYLGAVTLRSLAGLRADIYLGSTPAIIDDVCYHQHHEAVAVKQAMFESSAKRVLYADHTKFNHRALHAVALISEFDTVIVDSSTGQEHMDRLRDSGAELLIAKVGRH